MKQNITQDGLKTLLESLDGVGHRYMKAHLRTFPKLLKSHRTTSESLEVSLGCVGVVKESEGVYSIGIVYENAVNNALDRAEYEKNFEAKPLSWGEWVPGSKLFLTHKGEFYVRLYQYKNNDLCKECREVVYFKIMADGSEIEMSPTELETLKGFLPPEREKKTLVEGSFDEAKPIVNSVKMESIRYIKINGVEYTVKG
jgi:hypothetical protein